MIDSQLSPVARLVQLRHQDRAIGGTLNREGERLNDSREFRRTLGQFATGVTVITTKDSRGERHGFTANSFTSVSLDPPLILFCLSKNAGSFSVFEKAPYYAVNVLAGDQQPISERFARTGGDKFTEGDWTEGNTGVPILSNALAYFECRKWSSCDGGDHVIFVGEVLSFARKTGEPLVFHGGQYRNMA